MIIQWYHVYFFALISGTVALLLLTPMAQKAAAVFGVMDRPSEKHKFHGKAVPLLGGAAMFCGWLLVLGCGLLVWTQLDSVVQASVINTYFAGAYSVIDRLGFLALGAFLATALGTFDDIKHLKAAFNLNTARVGYRKDRK